MKAEIQRWNSGEVQMKGSREGDEKFLQMMTADMVVGRIQRWARFSIF